MAVLSSEVDSLKSTLEQLESEHQKTEAKSAPYHTHLLDFCVTDVWGCWALTTS